MSKPSPGTSPSTPKLVCENIWKVFGADARAALERHRFKPSPGALRAEGLTAAVRDATFSVEEGEIFVIMGLSGSGKSTLVRCMSRLIEPTAGRVGFDGVDLLAADERELIELRRHKMGMVFQHFALLPHLTVLANVAFPLEIQGVARTAREERAREMIELVGLAGREQRYPRELSGGQQQRVGIARSLAVRPEVWFLDEPFSALDPLIRRELQGEFMRLQSRLQKTIVFITHDFDEAIRLADRIAIMQDGAIIQIGTPEDLVVKPATDYVAEFTRHIPRAKVLTARTVMSPSTVARAAPASTPSVSAGTTVEALAETVLAADGAVTVLDEAGQVVGELTREAVIAVLAGRSPGA